MGRNLGFSPGVCDPDDDKMLETAVVGRADCIVTGDNDLLALRPIGEAAAVEVDQALFRSLAILRPAELLRFLEAAS